MFTFSIAWILNPLFAASMLVTAACLPALPSSAAQGQEPSLSMLIDKVMLAYGGKESFARQGSNCLLRGQEKTFSQSGAEREMIFRQIRRGTKLRIDLCPQRASPGASSITVFDGERAWKAGGRWSCDLPGEDQKVLEEDLDRQPCVLTHFGEPGYSFQLFGRTAYKQVPVFTIEVAHGKHSPTEFFIDEHNYLVAGSSYKTTDSQTNAVSTVDTEYSQYRPVDDTMVPFMQIQSVNGQKTLSLQLDGAEIKGSIDEAIFKHPLPGAAMHLDKPVVVPIEYTAGEIIIKARINGSQPLDFLLDTGASESMVDRRTAAEHFLDKQGQIEISGAAAAVTTDTSVVHKLELGALALKDVHALILDLSPQSRQMGRQIAGIIGSNVLREFIITIDYTGHTVAFSDALTYHVPAGATTVPFTEQPGITIVAGLNGQDNEPFLLDTGAAFNHLPASAAARYTRGTPEHFMEGTGLDGRPVRLGALVIDSVTVGKQKLSGVNFTYPARQEAASERGGFFQTASSGILGNPFWQNFLVSIDYHGHRLVLQPAAAAGWDTEAGKAITAGDTKLIIYRDYRAAETSYQKALACAQTAGDALWQARALGRLGNLHRVMAHDLNRPAQARVAYQYFNRAQRLARSAGAQEIEGRILADWSLLYSDNNQSAEAAQVMQAGLIMAPGDPYVNVDNAVHLYRAKLYGDMQKYVDKALFLDPSNWQALWYQVKLSEMFFDTARETTTLKEILRFYPWSKLAKEKLSALNALPAVPSMPAAP